MATNNGEDDQANEKNEELRREYHDLQNKISRCDINATEGLDIANEKLERVSRLFLTASICCHSLRDGFSLISFKNSSISLECDRIC